MQEIEPIALHQLSYESPVQSTYISWRPLLEKRLRMRVQEAALFVAERMRDPEYVKEIAEIASKQSLYPTGWSPVGLSSGDVGLAFMYSYIDACFPGQGFDSLTQQYLRMAAEGTRRSTLVFPPLFSGTAGLALTLSQASQGGKRYQKTLAHLHEELCKQVFTYPWKRSETTAGVASSDFDLISGAAGVLAYLVSIKQADTTIQSAIAHLLAYLLWLGEPGQPTGQERWYIPADLLPNERHRQFAPHGNFNCGLAHGIPGPLAALSLTWLAGYRYPSLRETIAYLADWVVGHRLERKWGIDWPDSVPLEKAATAQDWQQLSPTRSAWCYGTPGVARSLWLAGCVLEDKDMCRIGIEAIESALRRPVPLRQIPAPTLCHGVAGLLHICLRFAHECDSELIHAQIPVLAEQILETFDPSFALGFRDIEQDVLLDQPGWLSGAPGVAMVLLAASTDVKPTWDRVLAIA
jgi:lantibiotic biosynthesis protein